MNIKFDKLPFTLQQIRILKAIEVGGNYKIASKILSLSPQLIKTAVYNLQSSMHVKLFNEKKDRVVLTESGKVLLQYSNRILALCEESCRAVVDLKNMDRGHLNIGASEILGKYMLPKFLVIFRQKNPNINLSFKIEPIKQILNKIINQKIDIGIVENNGVKLQLKKLNIEQFIENEFHLIIAKNHPFAIKAKTTNYQIKKEDLYYLELINLNNNSKTQNFINNQLKNRKIDLDKLKITMQVDSFDIIKMGVSLGLGAAFVPSITIQDKKYLETITILKIQNITISWKLLVLSHKENYKSKAFSLFYKDLLLLKKSI